MVWSECLTVLRTVSDVTHPDTHLRELVQRVRPGVSERQLAKATGRSRPLRAFDTASMRRDLPPLVYVVDLAAALGVDVAEVLEAALLDAGLPTAPGYDRDQHRAARLVGTIPERGRTAVVDAVEALLAAMPWRVPS
jgi:hypothetical protein